ADKNTVDLVGNVTGLSVTTADAAHPINNETVAINLNAAGPADLSKLSSKATIKSSFANTTLNSADLNLAAPNIWDKLAGADIVVDGPGRPKLVTVGQPLSSAAEPPAG